MSAVHDFHQSLRASHRMSDWPIWEQIYRAAFPGFLAMVDHREDGEHQRAGIDRSVILENSKQLLVDEKVRLKDYPDIALEYLSNDARNTPGWVCKPLRADYIAYAIAPAGRCYLLPVPQLQLAWERKKDIWLSMYRPIKAKNNGYSTWSVCIPPEQLFPEIGRALRVSFDPIAARSVA